MLIEILRLVIVKLGMISLLLSPNCRSIKLENRTTSVNIQNNEYHLDSKCDSQEFIIADTAVQLYVVSKLKLLSKSLKLLSL